MQSLKPKFGDWLKDLQGYPKPNFTLYKSKGAPAAADTPGKLR
jgi:hypothetical protein